ncbi:VWA domain-containing protein [Streptomyces sp. NPDC001348]
MGLLTLLRNAFGRSRKGRTADAEGADSTLSPEPTVSSPTPEPEPQPEPTPHVPEPRREQAEEHDLVSAAFNNVTVPAQTTDPEIRLVPVVEPESAATVEAEPEPTAEAAPEPTPSAKAEADPDPAPSPAPDAEPPVETEPEPEAKAEPTPDEQPDPEPVAETAPEPAPSPEPDPEPEPVAEATPEPDPEPVAEATPKPEPDPEPVAEATPKPEPEPDPEPVAEATPEPEPVAEVPAEVEPEAKIEAEEAAKAESADAQPDEPAAADGEETPQGPPAPDDESSTGGAGGNDPAEGEAEAGQPAPATTLAKLKSRAPALATAYKAATATLKKNNLTGTRAKLYLVLDRSASMRPYYKDGSAQALAEQTLALAAHLDPEGTVPVVFFSTEVDGTGELTLTDHENKIDDLHAGLGRMGRTSYHAAVEAVLALHDKTADPTAPALVIFQTDGAPDAKTPATQSLTEAAKTHPAVFFSFVAFGEHDNKAFDYLRKLKTDNTSFFHAGPTPRELTDTELYEGVLATWRP